MKNKILFAGLILAVLFSGCAEQQVTAELVLTNGKIITLEKSLPDAEAVAINADTIFAVGTKAEIEKLIGDETEVIDLKGKLAIPGFIDSHAHFTGFGKSMQILDLKKARNWDEIVFMVADAAERMKPGEWILGRGWHQEKWDPRPQPNVNGFPVHDLISKAAPYNPVLLSHASGHAIMANRKAMDMAGINDATADPAGGTIVRDKNGMAIGVFKENAELLIEDVYDRYIESKSEAAKKEYYSSQIKLANDKCLELGITTVFDAGIEFDRIDLYKELADSGQLGVRLWVMIYEENEDIIAKIGDYKLTGYGNNHLTVGGIKKLMDGALGSRSAWFLQGYSDMPSNTGLQTITKADLEETARIALENNLQVGVHCIGDKANREVLNIYEKYYKQSESKDLRWRIEHAQHISIHDIPRFAEIGVIAAMQSIHCTSDAPYVENRLGRKRAEEGAYVWRKLLDSGAIISNGTDAPVEHIDPIACYYSAVTRKLSDGTSFYPDQKMTRMEALESYTINGAYSGFEENIKGSLKPGKLADITVLSKDILTIPENEILSTKVLYTIVGGKVLYKTDK